MVRIVNGEVVRDDDDPAPRGPRPSGGAPSPVSSVGSSLRAAASHASASLRANQIPGWLVAAAVVLAFMFAGYWGRIFIAAAAGAYMYLTLDAKAADENGGGRGPRRQPPGGSNVRGIGTMKTVRMPFPSGG
eukprot:m51a1_g14380 hypothetical protein (132) ;mRNA; f:288569-289155